MQETPFLKTVLTKFNMTPSESQAILFQKLEEFARSKSDFPLFIISGYAGTGKTSVLGAYVRALKHYKVETKLLAPTGRAAKVFSNKSNENALTIHKQIYRRKSKVDITSGLDLQPNLYKSTIFFVDEASMIGEYTKTKDGGVSARNLLDDLLDVFIHCV